MGEHAHPEVSLHTYPLGRYMDHIYRNDWSGVADLMIGSAKKLHQIGADFAISPDNTIHQAFARVEEESPLPWLHIAREVAKEAQRQGLSRLGILGTRYLMEGPVYPDELKPMGIDYLTPTPDQREIINQIIFHELVYGKILDESRQYFGEVIESLRDRGCDGVVLGCTEIPLLVTTQSSCLPTLDSTRVLARAALHHATGG